MCWGPVGIALFATVALWTLPDRYWLALPLGYGPRWIWWALTPLPLLSRSALRQRLAAIGVLVPFILWGLLGVRFNLPPLAPLVGQSWSIVSFNAALRRDAVVEVLQLAVKERVDAVIVVECPQGIEGQGNQAYQFLRSREVCLWTKHGSSPTISHAPRDPRSIGWAGTIAVITGLPLGSPRSVGVVHLRSVRNELAEFLDLSEILGQSASMQEMHEIRIAGSRFASEWFRSMSSPPPIVAGDFNLVPESPRFRADWSMWKDAFEERGVGTGYTWYSSWYGLRIDHVLAGGGWRVQNVTTGPAMGSDHRPVIATVVLPNQ